MTLIFQLEYILRLHQSLDSMAAFIGRKKELKKIDEVLSSGKPCFIIAESRMGATALVKRYCDNVKSIYVSFDDSTSIKAVESVRSAVTNFLGRPCEYENTVSELLSVVDSYSDEDGPVTVFDGVQFVSKGIVDEISEFIRKNPRTILIGNCDPDEFGIPFHDQIQLGELNLGEYSQFHPKMTPIDRLKTYMVAGNIPLYHLLLNKSDFESSVERAFLGNYPKLSAECEILLRKSSVPYPICNAILFDIANFTGRPIDVANTEGISRQLCDIYLKKLVQEGFIHTLNPMGNSPKKPSYIIRSPVLAFYFLVICRNPKIEFTDKPTFADISHHVDMFLELRFRDICEMYIRTHYDCTDIGRWWEKEEDTQKTTLVATVVIDGMERTIVADCKFRDGKIDQGALKALQIRAEHIREVPKKTLMMFSISGFEDKLVKKSKAGSVVLIGPTELLEWFNGQ